MSGGINNRQENDMGEKNTGGPAFPCTITRMRQVAHQSGTFPTDIRTEGMTMRDYFAAKVLSGMMYRYGNNLMTDSGLYAKQAYQFADAMLREREK